MVALRRRLATKAAPRLIDVALRKASTLEHGRLSLDLPDGRSEMVLGPRPGPEAHLRLHRSRAIRRFLSGGSLGFAEAFVDGDWDSDDLPRLLELFCRNEQIWWDGADRNRSLARLRSRVVHALRRNSRRGSRRNILAHYDLGNAFFARWLDPDMIYSSARYACQDEPLDAAQRNKLRDIARLCGLRPGSELLEIGCGWGAFAELVAKETGARVTAITVSDEQHAFASARIQREGLNDRVEVRLQDYRDVDGRYDAIASIEMIEAVGERYWPVFFARLRDLLRPGGRVGLQAITIADRYFDGYRRGCDFIQRHIFPGGMLPSPGALSREMARAGLYERSRAAFAADYARTLAEWNRRFEAAWSEIRALGFDDRFRRLWLFYLSYCEAGFRAGYTDLLQLGLVRR